MSGAAELYGFGFDMSTLLWEGDLEVNGDLWLDDDQYTGSLAYVSEIGAFVIKGDLKVSGSIINDEGDYGINLIVLGDVLAKNAIFGGSNVFINGNVTLTGYAVAFYNHGMSNIEGRVRAKGVINHDNGFGGKYEKDMQVLEWGGIGVKCLEDYCLPFFLEDGYPEIDDIKKAILTGEPFLDEKKAKTVSVVVQKALDAFAKGKKVKTLSLRGHKGVFPEEIFRLDSLEVLDLRDTTSPPPAELNKMPNLKEVIVKPGIYINKKFVDAIGGLSCLERLTFKGPNSWFKRPEFDLMIEPLCKNLGGLRQLTIPMVTNEMLQLLPNLESLLLRDCGGGTTYIEGGHPSIRKLVIESSSGILVGIQMMATVRARSRISIPFRN